MFVQKKVLITGGGGFIGSHLVAEIVRQGAEVTVVDRNVTALQNLRQSFQTIELIRANVCDSLDNGNLKLAGYNYIFHLAGNNYVPRSVEDPNSDFDANLQTSFRLLDTLRSLAQPPHLINISSAAVYGNPSSMPIREETPVRPISPYGVSKLAVEQYCAVFSQLYGLPVNSARIFSVYGPRQRKLVIYDLLHKIQQNPYNIEILGDGTQERDFIYVVDVVQALIKIALYGDGKGTAYNVASGTSISINALVQILCEVCGVNPQRIYTGKRRPGDPDKWNVDISALRFLSFSPVYALQQGLKLVRDWYADSLTVVGED